MHVVVVGESLVDVLVSPDGTQEVPGGSCLNVAVGLSRLGARVSLVTSYGDDDPGRLIAQHLEGVDVRRVPGPTSRAVAELDEAGSATYRFEFGWDLGVVVPHVPVSSHLHVGSLGSVVPPGSETVLQLVRGHQGTVSFDPNCRAGFGSPARVEELVAHADIVKLSDEDAQQLYPGRSIEDLARDWLARGPELVVVTRGPAGAEGWTFSAHEWVPSPAGSAVVDTVGAGDAFMAGLIHAWLRGGVLRSVLVHAARIARLTCERAGAQPPTLAELA
jgi:fructokinase